MRITRTEKGKTKINLAVLTPDLYPGSRFIGYGKSRIRMPCDAITTTPQGARAISDEFEAFFKGHDELKLRIWLIDGKLANFSRDLIVKQ